MSLIAALVPAVVAVGVIALLRASASLSARFLDRPGRRSLHATATPRFGGLGLLLGALPMVFLLGTPEVRAMAGVAAALAAVSLVDDLRPLPVAVRLPCHFAAAVLAVGIAWPDGAPMNAASLGVAATGVLAIAWMTNVFNFMDGADGLAGGMATIGFAALAWAAHRAGDAGFAQVLVALSAGAAGFLAFNYPPARVFMGDAGSVPLGFLAGALGGLGIVRGLWPWWFPVLVFSPFIVDATVTLAWRVARRKAFLQAHRDHYYQRLVLGGWSHGKLAAAAWALMAAVASSAVAAVGQQPDRQGAIILLWVIAYGALLFLVGRLYPRETS